MSDFCLANKAQTLSDTTILWQARFELCHRGHCPHWMCVEGVGADDSSCRTMGAGKKDDQFFTPFSNSNWEEKKLLDYQP